MPKNLIQDIKRPGLKKKKVPDRIIYPKIEQDISFLPPRVKVTDRPSESGRRPYAIWGVAFASVVFLFFALSYFFSGAKIIINPKLKNIALNQDFSVLDL